MTKHLTKKNKAYRYKDEVENFFDDMFHNYYLTPKWSDAFERLYHNKLSFDVDTSDDEKAYYIEAEIPGMNEKDIHLSIENNTLIIKGEKEENKEASKTKNYYSLERKYGSFMRSFNLPENVDEDNISASYSEGVLKVVVPKSQQKSKRKTIDIKKA